MNYQTIFLDLDGTLVDSKPGIISGLIYALQGYHIQVEDPEKELLRFIGPPLRDSFQTFYGFSPLQADLALERYREYFQEKGIYENEMYEGIPALLVHWKQQGRELILATSKPTIYAEQILKDHQIDGYFSFVAGATLNTARSSKVEVLEYAMEHACALDKRTAAMVGDRMFDILAAGQLGISGIGVSYGYGDRAELEEAGAVAVADSVAELAEILEKE